jgi:threonine dehydratase
MERASAISTERIEAAARSIDPLFLNSPQYVSEALSTYAGAKVLLKVETANPLGSFKGRGTGWLLASGRHHGPLVCASAGNFGQGLAFAGRRHGVPVHVFASVSADAGKIEAMRRLGANVVQEGDDFDAAKEAARAFGEAKGYAYIEDGREPEIAEGAGTIALELTRWPEPIDRIYVPVGNGALAAGMGSWFKARSPATRVIGVCASAAPAMEMSWRRGAPVSTASADTIADGIAVRVPVPESLPPLAAALDDIVLVEDTAIVSALRLLFDVEHTIVEPSGAIALAAALADQASIAGQTVGIPLTGRNADSRRLGQWLGIGARASPG